MLSLPSHLYHHVEEMRGVATQALMCQNNYSKQQFLLFCHDISFVVRDVKFHTFLYLNHSEKWASVQYQICWIQIIRWIIPAELQADINCKKQHISLSPVCQKTHSFKVWSNANIALKLKALILTGLINRSICLSICKNLLNQVNNPKKQVLWEQISSCSATSLSDAICKSAEHNRPFWLNYNYKAQTCFSKKWNNLL